MDTISFETPGGKIISICVAKTVVDELFTDIKQPIKYKQVIDHFIERSVIRNTNCPQINHINDFTVKDVDYTDITYTTLYIIRLELEITDHSFGLYCISDIEDSKERLMKLRVIATYLVNNNIQTYKKNCIDTK